MSPDIAESDQPLRSGSDKISGEERNRAIVPRSFRVFDSGDLSTSVTDKPRTFVLVHGAWHGGWCWRRVADVLRARGHRVFSPSLTGLGDRAHLFSKDISLQTHVEDILSVVETEELSDFVLHQKIGLVRLGL